MIIHYSNLRYVNLLEIKRKFPELIIAFNFLDYLAFELKKVSLEQQNCNTIIFIDYRDSKRYFVNIDKTNEILYKCYNEFYLKIVLNDVNIKLKLDLIWNHNKWLDIFSKNLFYVAKNFFYRPMKDKKNSYFISSAIINSSVKDFSNIKDFNEYSNNVIKKIIKLDFSNLVKIYSDYFPISYDTFKFSKYENLNDYCRLFQSFDFERYLNGKVYYQDSKLTRLEKSIQLLTLISFLNAKYIYYRRHHYIDNSFITSRIDSYKEMPDIETENYKECLHFNNL